MRNEPAPIANDSPVGRLAQLAHDAGSRPVPDAWRERTLAAIARKPQPSRAPYVLALAAAGLAALVILLRLVLRPEAALAYSVEGAPASGSYVSAGPGGATARFSEGTQIGFTAGTRGRIVAVTARGARVSIDEGAAHLRVVHRENAEWTVEAGPFTIAVTGTEFDVVWHREQLEVTMQAGTVIVRGPLISDGVALHHHQHLSADLVQGALSIVDVPLTAAVEPAPSDSATPREPAAVADAAEPATPVTLPVGSGASASGSPSLRRPLPIPPSFRERVARGDFTGVIADAEAEGIDAAITTSSLADLAALADAARYAGRGDLARRALLAERSRFAGSAEARSAAFLLGRMTETSSPSAAVGWYDVYLTESPGGSLAPEALGRKLVAMKGSSDRRAARAVATEYLRRYPGGAFAGAASELLSDD